MIGFFAVIIAADTTLIYKAVSTFGGVDNPDAYREGLTYNERIASEARQSALGWQETIEALTSPARLRVKLKDKDGNPVIGLRLEATLSRPATNRSDVTIALTEVAPGVFESVAALQGDGAWIADVRAIRSGETAPAYQARRRLWLAP
jgi:nitrogen fixation protein FixH